MFAVALILARSLVDTPSLSSDLQRTPGTATVQYVDDRVVDLLVGAGLTFVGLMFVAVFVASLVRQARSAREDSLSAPLIGVGGSVVVATTFVGYAFMVVLAGATENGAPTTVASIYTIADSLGYIGWTPLGIVTA